MTPYREPGKTVDEKDPEDLMCTCGHLQSKHHWFNSEFVGCVAKGYYKETHSVDGVITNHQLKEICQCQRFVHRCESPLVNNLYKALTDMGNAVAFLSAKPGAPEAVGYISAAKAHIVEIIAGLKKGQY